MKNKLSKNIKTISSYVLALSIVVSSFGFVPIAQADITSTLTIGSQTAAYNDIITVPVTANIVNIQGIQLSINYPESMLRYVGCSSTHIVCSTDVASSTNKINLTWYDVLNFLTLNNEDLLSLQFQVVSSGVTDTVLSFTPVEVINNIGTDITGNITFNSGTLTLNPVATLSSVAITHPANKLTYTVGDALDITGLVVTGTYSDASTEVETITTANVTGFDSSVPATGQVLTITVEGQTVTYTIDVVDAPDTTPPTISLFYPADNATNVSVDVQPTLTFSEAIDTSTMNGENIELREYATLSSDAEKVPAALTYSIGNKVTFILSSPLEHNKQYYFFVGTGVKDIAGNSFAADTWYHAQRANHEFTTEALPVTLSSLTITHLANKLSYFVGEPLDITGLEITGHYSDGSTEIVTPVVVTGFDSSAPVTGQVLTATFGGKSTTYMVDIIVDVGSIGSTKTITAFTIPGQIGETIINEEDHTVNLTMPYGTDKTNLIPNIVIDGSSIDPNTGVAQDFTNPIIYKVTAADTTTQDYIVTINVAANSAKDIVSFSFPEGNGVITGTNIAVTVPFGTDITDLVPTIVLSGGTISPLSEVAQNFTNSVTYTVTASDGLTKTYTVTVTVAPNSAANILSFNSTFPVAVGVISGANINLTLPFGTSLVDLPITISLSTGASVLPATSNTTFTDGVATIYTVTAQDGVTTQNYSVTVNVAPNTAKEITSFNFEGLTPSVTGIINGTNITLNVPYGTDITNLVPTIGITGSSVNPVSGITQDFTNPSTYTVTAADGTTQNYTVTVVIAAPSDLTLLAAAITSAQALHDAAVEGNSVGEYPAPLKANLQTAINTASTITPASAQSVVDAAVTTLNAAVATFEAGVVLPDTTAPVITLNGSSPMNMTIGQTYTEPGATATDNVDASVSVTVGGDNVDTSVVGTYEVTYNAVDAAGNHATQVVRTVVISDLVVSTEETASPTTDSITITWTTSHPSTSRVIYDIVSHNPIIDPAPNYGYSNSTIEDATLVTAHSVTVNGLSSGTTYYFRPVSHGSPEIVGDEVSVTTTTPTPVSSSSGSRSGGSSSSSGSRHLVVTTPVVAPTVGIVLGSSAYNFTRNLSVGSFGNDVTELQNRLISAGVYSGPITGYFGSLTQAAVQAFQAKYGISSTGFVGPLTLAQLNQGTQAVLGVQTTNFSAILAQLDFIRTQAMQILQTLQNMQ
ncbi:MAG: Ig-like domain-containing protein [Candidatus Paceibacterota bacterium]|jgi:hypothetical protein